MSDFTDLPDLACARLDGRVLAANDEFFAPKENLIADAAPVWDADRYTEQGKWMDGWETRRRRDEGDDWCLLRLGLPGIPRGIVVDTAYFRGNYPESCSLEGCEAPAEATAEELLAGEGKGEGGGDGTVEWHEVLARSPLAGDTQNRFELDTPWRCTHLRLRIQPDGGVARLRVHGQVVPRLEALTGDGAVNLASLALGARVLAASDRFFSSPNHLLLPDEPRGMHDGWETRRRRGPGNDWVVVELAAAGSPQRIEVDTSFFKGNAPGSCSLEGAELPAGAGPLAADDPRWLPLLPRTELQPHRRHELPLAGAAGAVRRVRLQIYPDGGVARLRVFGRLAPGAREEAALAELDALPPAVARRRLLDCCGSPRWAAEMAARRPFGSRDSLLAAAGEVADGLTPEDWLDAFAAHPPIGGGADGSQGAERPRGATAAAWSEGEQAGAAQASGDVRDRLAEGNQRYRERFGHLFIVCARGRSGEEMLAELDERLAHDPGRELAVAAGEERKITRLRLDKLLGEE